MIDSSNIRHYNDSRQFPAGGIGSGEIRFRVDSFGRPIQFQFGPGDSWFPSQIAIGRLVGMQGVQVRQ
ncbi:hypothetical protein D3C83_174270 [compost metagenome]